MATKISMISIAFGFLGKAAVNDLNVDNITELASAIYDDFYPTFLTQTKWRFNTFQKTLGKTTETPVIEDFDNIFQLPPDYLVAWRISPNVTYQIYEDKLYTNSDSVKLEYAARVTENQLPTYVVTYIETALAELLAMPLTQTPELVELWAASAKNKLNIAIYLDAQSRTPTPIQDEPFLAAHAGPRSNSGSGVFQ